MATVPCIVLARRPNTLACRLLRKPQGNKRLCGLMDKALVFGTKYCRLESCQGHAARKARIATPDHAGLLASARRHSCYKVDIANRARYASR